MYRGILSIVLLLIANVFMTFAWYGHLKLQNNSWILKLGLVGIVLMSWGIAFFEYCLQVPANRIGYDQYGGPFNLWQLKIIQEVITLVVFAIFTLLVFKNESLKWNHFLSFIFILLAVYFMFKK